MAITKAVITAYAEMAQFIEDSGLFDSVVYDASGDGSITCKDADDNTVFAIIGIDAGVAQWYGYADASNGVYEQISGSVRCTAYSTAKGLMFVNPGSHNGAPCIVSKTNNDAYCVLLPTDNKGTWSSGVYHAMNQKAIAWGDVAPFTNLVNSGVVITGVQSNYYPVFETANQTVFLPIVTHSTYGTPSYFADAFFLPISQFRSETVFSIDGVKYVTDGFACLRDE